MRLHISTCGTGGVMPGIASNAGEGIVGQSGFFDHFRYVKFDKRRGLVELGRFEDEASPEERL